MWLAIIFFVSVFYIFRKRQATARKRKLIDLLPGPKGLPIVGNALQFVGVTREDRMEAVLSRDKKYGPIYRNWIGSLPYVHITSTELAEPILSLRNVKKGQIYTFLQPWLGRGVLTSDGEEWSKSRKLITPTFHFQILESFIDTFGETARTLITNMKKVADKKDAVDLYPLLTLAALDAILETAMGTSIDAQNNTDAEYAVAVNEILRLTFLRYDTFWLHSDFTWKLSKHSGEAQKALDILHGYTDQVLQERKLARARDGDGDARKRAAFIDLLLDENEKQKMDFSDTQVRNEITTFIFEGHDTTTAGLTFALLELGNNLRLQEEAFQEQQSVLGDDANICPTTSQLNEMSLLDRILKETLRMYPSVPFISRTLVDDTKVGEYLIPKGSVTLISLHSIMRDPKIYKNPDKFDPDRFLPENSVGRTPFGHVPFSAGPRNCLGKRFAMMEAKVYLSYILRNFRVEATKKPEEIKVIIEIVRKPSPLTPAMFKLHKRNPEKSELTLFR